MDKMNNFDQAKPLEDMDPGERVISNTGGVTQQKAEEITHPKPEYNQREAHINIVSKSNEEFEKLNTFQKSVFNKYGLDLNKETDSKIFDSMSEEMLLERLKILEATIVLAKNTKEKTVDSEIYYEKLLKEYTDEVIRYQDRYKKEHHPIQNTDPKEAEEIILNFLNPENKEHQKKDLKPEAVLEEQLY